MVQRLLPGPSGLKTLRSHKMGTIFHVSVFRPHDIWNRFGNKSWICSRNIHHKKIQKTCVLDRCVTSIRSALTKPHNPRPKTSLANCRRLAVAALIDSFVFGVFAVADLVLTVGLYEFQNFGTPSCNVHPQKRILEGFLCLRVKCVLKHTKVTNRGNWWKLHENDRTWYNKSGRWYWKWWLSDSRLLCFTYLGVNGTVMSPRQAVALNVFYPSTYRIHMNSLQFSKMNSIIFHMNL